ncbi:trimeric intracellular cation channel family protein [Longitalea arenae]|uniref:trimeric intracellular cation channel family protein n=1 Tax=Longitalea arenae TaxID=2812558 RepID=UPI00196812F2|nr:trimeric intracellular cation channel family protein [Longitalea arenae]
MKAEFLRLIDILGTCTFAISGVFAAMQKRLDLFGILIIAFITAIGGGTLRDLLIGDLPVSWMRSINTPLIILASAVSAILFRNVIHNFQQTLFIFDSLGLGFFTVLGLQKGITFGLHPLICIALGTITGCFGGVIRDILLNNIPMIFRKEIYATACILGGIIYFLLLEFNFNKNWLDVVVMILIFIFRFVVVKYNLELPAMYGDKKEPDKH